MNVTTLRLFEFDVSKKFSQGSLQSVSLPGEGSVWLERSLFDQSVTLDERTIPRKQPLQCFEINSVLTSSFALSHHMSQKLFDGSIQLLRSAMGAGKSVALSSGGFWKSETSYVKQL